MCWVGSGRVIRSGRLSKVGVGVLGGWVFFVFVSGFSGLFSCVFNFFSFVFSYTKPNNEKLLK